LKDELQVISDPKYAAYVPEMLALSGAAAMTDISLGYSFKTILGD
jgi:hypothetical protein